MPGISPGRRLRRSTPRLSSTRSRATGLDAAQARCPATPIQRVWQGPDAGPGVVRLSQGRPSTGSGFPRLDLGAVFLAQHAERAHALGDRWMRCSSTGPVGNPGNAMRAVTRDGKPSDLPMTAWTTNGSGPAFPAAPAPEKRPPDPRAVRRSLRAPLAAVGRTTPEIAAEMYLDPTRRRRAARGAGQGSRPGTSTGAAWKQDDQASGITK